MAAIDDVPREDASGRSGRAPRRRSPRTATLSRFPIAGDGAAPAGLAIHGSQLTTNYPLTHSLHLMNSRNGKIARLPKAIREELNRQLDEGASGRSLVAWLNGLPEVHAVLEAHFEGTEIREQNLSEWKKGGFQEWRRHREAMALAERLYERAEELRAKGEEQMPMSEVLSLWLAARYAVATEEVAAMTGEEGWKQLRQMCGDVSRLRRMDQQAQKLALDAERVELQREELIIEQDRWKEEKRALRRAAKAAENARRRKKKAKRGATAAERARRIAEIYGRI